MLGHKCGIHKTAMELVTVVNVNVVICLSGSILSVPVKPLPCFATGGCVGQNTRQSVKLERHLI